MGNFLALCIVGDVQCKEALLKEKKILQIVKDDGKILEFTSPVKVRDLLVSYPSYYVGIFKEATQALPLDHKLKVGKIYYLLPSLVDHTTTKEDHEDARRELDQRPTTTIKVVVTKEQLQQILRKQGRVEELLLGVVSNNNNSSDHGCSSSSNWFPKLESIPEGISSDLVC